MVFQNKYSKILMDSLVSFKKSKYLPEQYELMGSSGPVSIYTTFTALTHYMVETLLSKNSLESEEKTDAFNLIESVLEKYDCFPEGTEEYDYANAACVCFLENLLNNASNNIIEYSSFIPFLGPESRKFCKGWDAFTGVRSPGLWEDDEWDESQKNRS